MLTWKYHTRELKYRLIYSTGSWIITSAVVWVEFDDIIFAMTPSIPTLITYQNALEVLTTKLEVSIILGAWFVVPHVVNMIWLFIRPGLYEREAQYGLRMRDVVGPWVIYYSIIEIISWTLVTYSSYYYRFLPTLTSTTTMITNIIIISYIVYMIPKVFMKMIKPKTLKFFVKHRWLIIMGEYGVLAMILPPDIIYTIMALIMSIGTLETLMYGHKLKTHYLNHSRDRLKGERKGGEERGKTRKLK